METGYKYFRPKTAVTNSVKPERARLYDRILIDIIDNGMLHRDACRKNNFDHRGFARICLEQRERGLVIPEGRITAARFDPNGPFRYWVVFNAADTYDNPARKTVEFGKMWDRIIDELIIGTPTKTITEAYGFSSGTVISTLNRLRAAGSPIPWLMPRKNIENRGITANPEIYYKPGRKLKVRPLIVEEWKAKRESGYTFSWIAGEYGVSATTVSQHVRGVI